MRMMNVQMLRVEKGRPSERSLRNSICSLEGVDVFDMLLRNLLLNNIIAIKTSVTSEKSRMYDID